MPPSGKDLCPDRTTDECKQAQNLGNRRHFSTPFPKPYRANCYHNQTSHCPSSAIPTSTPRASPWFYNSIRCIYPDRSSSIDLPLPRPFPSDNTQSKDHEHWFDPLKYQAQPHAQSIAPTIPPRYTTPQYSRLRHAVSPPMPDQFLGRCRAPSHPNTWFPNACECATPPLPLPMQHPHSW